MSCGQHVESLSRIDFLDRTYRYESVHSQIPQDVGFTLIVENFFPTGDRTSTKAHSVSLKYALNLVTTFSLYLCNMDFSYREQSKANENRDYSTYCIGLSFRGSRYMV